MDGIQAAAGRFRGRRVLVTGGFGFLGSHTTRALADAGAYVTCLDISTTPRRTSLINAPEAKLRRRIRIQTADMTDPSVVRRVVDRGRFHAVFHYAAYATVVEKALQAPFETIRSNTLAWVNLLEALRLRSPRPDAVVFVSTDKVYGENGGKPYDEERTPLRGIGVYDSAKLAADIFARTYHEAYGLPTITVRLCNIFGPWDFNTGYRLVPRTLEGLYGRAPMRPPEIYDDSLGHRRDYLYVDDAVRALLMMAAEPRCRGEVYNMSCCRNLGPPQMLAAVLKAAVRLERRLRPERAAAMARLKIVERARAAGSSLKIIARQHLKSRKLREMLGFVPRVGFSEGLDRTVRFYRGYYAPRRPRP